MMKKISWISYFLYSAVILIITAGASYALDSETPETALPDNGLPVVVIEIDETEGHTIKDMNNSSDHSVKCYGSMSIIVPDGFRYCDLDIAPESLGPVPLDYIRGRGNSTWKAEKKPYRIKLENKTDVFGLGKNKHWVLLANAFDTTTFKNRFVGWLGDELNFDFTPRGVPVDVVMIGKQNGEEKSREYLGNYLFAEQLRIGENRLDIHELTTNDTEPDEITGGYLIQNGNQVTNASPDKFYTDREFCLANDSPTFDPSDSDYTNEEQKKYIRERIQDMEDAIFGEGVEDDAEDTFTNAKGIRYTDYMDMESAAKYWLVQELTNNGDAFITGSTYFYKKPDAFDESGQMTERGKFYWGPLWDFDIAFETDNPDNNVEDFNLEFAWIRAMLYDGDEDGFRETVKRVWPQIKELTLSAIEENGLIDKYCEESAVSYAADYEKWKDTEGYRHDSPDDYDTSVSNLKQWTVNRINWMDSHILGVPEDGLPSLDEAVCKVSYVADGRTVRRDYCRSNSYLTLCYPGHQDNGYAPEKTGYVFTGWIKEDGSSAEQGIVVTRDTTLTAQFVEENQATHAEELRFRMDEEWCSFDETRTFKSKYTIIPSDAKEKKVAWSSSDEDIATVDTKGKVTLYGTGTVTITGRLSNGTESSYELTITTSGAQPEMEDLTIVPEEINLKVGKHEQIGATVIPKLSRFDQIWFFSEDIGIASVDENGVVTGVAPGKTKVSVEAEYYDEETDNDISRTKYCTVTVTSGSDNVPKPVSIKNAKVELSKTLLTYNGKIQKPSIRTIGGKALKAGTDYTAKWSNNSSKNVGSYTITITGKGDYIDVTKTTYKINPKGTKLKKLKKAKKAITVKWKKQSAKMSKSRITGYQIQLATNKQFTKNKKTVTVKGYKKVSRKVKKLKGGKKYYIKIRTYKTVGGKKYFSPWSKVKTMKTKK